MGGYTYKRIESNILNVLNHTLIHDIYDEELKRASFTNVKLSNDSSVAWIYVDTYARPSIASLVNKLNDCKGVFKKHLATKMTIRKIPDIRFIIDESIEKSLKIEEILSKIKG